MASGIVRLARQRSDLSRAKRGEQFARPGRDAGGVYLVDLAERSLRPVIDDGVRHRKVGQAAVGEPRIGKRLQDGIAKAASPDVFLNGHKAAGGAGVPGEELSIERRCITSIDDRSG